MSYEDILRLLVLFVIPAISVLLSTILQIYNFIHLYSILTLYCVDNQARDKACDNLIKLTSLITINYQITVGAVCSILIKSYLHSSSCLVEIGLIIGVILYILCWNAMLITSVLYEQKKRLWLCWSTVYLKPAVLCYLMTKVTSLKTDDFFIFSLLTMITVTILADVFILCGSVRAYQYFGKGVREKVIAAKRAVNVLSHRQRDLTNSRRPPSTIHIV